MAKKARLGGQSLFYIIYHLRYYKIYLKILLTSNCGSFKYRRSQMVLLYRTNPVGLNKEYFDPRTAMAGKE